MALGLHPNALKLMKEELTKGLGKVQVENGHRVNAVSTFLAAYFANEKIPKTGKTYERLLDLVDDVPFVEFVGKTLQREVLDTLDYEKDTTTTLDQIGIFTDIEALADSLVQRFDSLFWRYNFSVEIPPTMFPSELAAVEPPSNAESFRLVRSDLFLEQTFPLTHENKKIADRAKPLVGLLALISPEAAWQADRLYLQNEVDGFVGVYGGTPTVNFAENALESFVGLGIANRVFRYQYQYDHKPIKSQWIVHRRVGEGWEFDSRFGVEQSICDVLAHVETFKFSDDYPVESRPRWINRRLKIIESVYSAKDTTAILLSSKWLFDSYKRAEDSLAFVRLMTSLEILLGERLDTSRASIGETIGNRLAYLIGKNRQDRNEILDYFKNVYRTRSKILHNGKHRLVGDEKKQLAMLRDYVLRAILAECDAMVAD